MFFVLGDCIPKWKQVIAQQEKVIDLSAQVIRTSSAAHDAKDALIAQLSEHNDFLRARAQDAESGIDPAMAFMGGAAVTAVVVVATFLVAQAVE